MLEKRTGLAILWQCVLDHVLTRAESNGIEAATSGWEPSTTKAANVITTARPVFSHRHFCNSQLRCQISSFFAREDYCEVWPFWTCKWCNLDLDRCGGPNLGAPVASKCLSFNPLGFPGSCHCMDFWSWRGLLWAPWCTPSPNIHLPRELSLPTARRTLSPVVRAQRGDCPPENSPKPVPNFGIFQKSQELEISLSNGEHTCIHTHKCSSFQDGIRASACQIFELHPNSMHIVL